MDVVQLTRQLVDIESVTGNETAVAEFLLRHLEGLGYQTARIGVEPQRFNVWAAPADARPALVFSTHMDTVPPFFASREDSQYVYGRGACDAKGIIAAEIAAAEELRRAGVSAGLLFTVGEETDSIGAKTANRQPPAGVRFLINGEPTDNKLAVATKGVLHVELVAQGRMAHSAYPELGESAIEKLLDAIAKVRALPLPRDPAFGEATLNIGTISGGRAPNVISDEARALLLYRTVTAPDELKQQIRKAVGGLVGVEFGAESPFVKLRTVDGLPTSVVAFSTDIPHLSAWGEPLLFGPGSIHVAHTADERVSKQALQEAVAGYVSIARKLLG